ncbi:hypothetical protein ACN4EK_31495 [Pantanalinema rosaneae CENA516]
MIRPSTIRTIFIPVIVIGQMEVIEPLELRDRVVKAAKEAIALHTRR